MAWHRLKRFSGINLLAPTSKVPGQPSGLLIVKTGTTKCWTSDEMLRELWIKWVMLIGNPHYQDLKGQDKKRQAQGFTAEIYVLQDLRHTRGPMGQGDYYDCKLGLRGLERFSASVVWSCIWQGKKYQKTDAVGQHLSDIEVIVLHLHMLAPVALLNMSIYVLAEAQIYTRAIMKGWWIRYKGQIAIALCCQHIFVALCSSQESTCQHRSSWGSSKPPGQLHSD